MHEDIEHHTYMRPLLVAILDSEIFAGFPGDELPHIK